MVASFLRAHSVSVLKNVVHKRDQHKNWPSLKYKKGFLLLSSIQVVLNENVVSLIFDVNNIVRSSMCVEECNVRCGKVRQRGLNDHNKILWIPLSFLLCCFVELLLHLMNFFRIKENIIICWTFLVFRVHTNNTIRMTEHDVVADSFLMWGRQQLVECVNCSWWTRFYWNIIN